MTELIRSVDLKLERAKAQASRLASSIAEWAAQGAITHRCELREGRLGFRLIQQGYSVDPNTDEWGLLVGECVHNVRSALDNLAFALARLRRDPPAQPSAISFPIVRSNRADFTNNNRKCLDQLPEEAALLIERLQPFQRAGSPDHGTPEQDALVQLQDLNNADKHRVPSIILIAPTEMQHSPQVEFYSEEDASANLPPDTTIWAGPLRAGVVLLEYRTRHPIARVSGQFAATAVVALETKNGPAAAPAYIHAIRDYTALVVDQFRRFF